MEHDNYDPDLDLKRKIKSGIPKRNGLYLLYTYTQSMHKSVGLSYLYEGEWLSFPSKFSLNTLSVNDSIRGHIGPLPEDV